QDRDEKEQQQNASGQAPAGGTSSGHENRSSEGRRITPHPQETWETQNAAGIAPPHRITARGSRIATARPAPAPAGRPVRAGRRRPACRSAPRPPVAG